MFNIIELEDADEGLMLLNRCPQCKKKDIGLQKVVNRNGYNYKLTCNNCGYTKPIIEFNEDIPTDDSLLEVYINGKKTGLIVDKYDMDKKTINLIVHKKELTIKDMMENIIDDNYPHHKRVCNQLNKLIDNRANHKDFHVLDIDNGCVLIKIMNYNDSIRLMPNYKKDMSLFLDIPLRYISHFYTKYEHYLIVNCKAYYKDFMCECE